MCHTIIIYINYEFSVSHINIKTKPTPVAYIRLAVIVPESYWPGDDCSGVIVLARALYYGDDIADKKRKTMIYALRINTFVYTIHTPIKFTSTLISSLCTKRSAVHLVWIEESTLEGTNVEAGDKLEFWTYGSGPERQIVLG